MSLDEPITPFASDDDYDECKRLHRRFGTTYYFSSLAFPTRIRRRTHALYGFVRLADEWVDNPFAEDRTTTANRLCAYRAELIRGLDGVRPDRAVLRAFCDVIREARINTDEALTFLAAMEQDLTVQRYETYDDLLGYMRGSAAAVGLMMCSVMEMESTPDVVETASAMANAMQLTNFLRDVGEDAKRGRIYIPMEDLERFDVTEGEILQGRVTPQFVDLMKFEIQRARDLYAVGDSGLHHLPKFGRKPVRLARTLYSRILDRIEDRGYDVFAGRARTTRAEKLAIAARLLLS